MAGRFVIDLQRFAKRANADVKQAVRAVTMEAFKRVIFKTAVDTGRARANWSPSVDSPVTYSIIGEDKSGSATIKRMENGVMMWECTGSIFLSNNLPYIIPLEYGHSTQEPNGMVRITVAEMQAWARQASNYAKR